MRHPALLPDLPAHVCRCPFCRGNEYGLCRLGFRILERLARLWCRRSGRPQQLELALPADIASRPFVRMFLNRKHM
jgi:hypothetical protein